MRIHVRKNSINGWVGLEHGFVQGDPSDAARGLHRRSAQRFAARRFKFLQFCRRELGEVSSSRGRDEKRSEAAEEKIDFHKKEFTGMEAMEGIFKDNFFSFFNLLLKIFSETFQKIFPNY